MSDPSDDFALLRTYRSAAIAALAAGDYGTAIQQALAAQVVLDTMPGNITRGMASGVNQTLAWSTQGIDQFIVRCRQQQGAQQGVSVQNNAYVAPTESTQNDSISGYV